MRLRPWRLLAAVCALLGALPARALDAALPVALAHHTAWSSAAEAPSNIVAMAQTPDGFLWLGTGGGLVRFDGVRFERIDTLGGHPRLSGSITALQAMPDGRLLIGHRFSGVSILGPAGLQHFFGVPGLPVGNCWAFAVDAAGDVWGAFTGGVARLREGRWQAFALDGEAVPFRTLVRDAEGTLWVTARTGAYALAPGAAAFQRVQADLPAYPYLSVAPGGQVWAADFARSRLVALARSGTGFQAAPGVPPVALPPQGDRHWFDADGGLWVRGGDGAWRMPRPGEGPIVDGLRRPALQRFGAAEGLDGDFHSFLEDLEGNVWLGTAGGLHRLRQAPVTRVPMGAADAAVGVAAAAEGGVWATSEFGGLYRVGAGGDPLAVEPLGLAGQRLSHLHRDGGGVLWVGSRSALWRIVPGQPPQRVPRPDAGDNPAGFEFAPIHAMAVDRAGVLWAHLVVKGTFRRVEDRWEKVDDDPGARVMSMGNDAQGRLWIGYIDRGAARIDGDEVLAFGPAQGLDIGAVYAVHGRGPRVWLGGQRGLALFDADTRTMKTLPLPGQPQPGLVTGVVETAEGVLWLHAAAGLMRIEPAEWRRAFAEPGYTPRSTLYDGRDGLLGSASQIRPLPSLVQAQDGRLWAALPSGLFMIDPARLRLNVLPPAVKLRAVAVDGRRFEAGAPLTLPTGRVDDLRFDYTATSLSVPQRVRFRYRLEGYDTDWRDAGAQREAAYTRVGPGRYEFRVIAANNDGVWNEEGARLALTVPPAFWQTPLFAAALALLAAGLLAALFRWRVRQVSRRLQERLDTRLQERERIARELHDTLLQGVTGLTLHVQAAADEAPAGSPWRQRLDTALDRANDVIVQARDRVTGLRLPERSSSRALAASLAAACRELAAAFRGPACRFEVQGEERALAPQVADEVDLIAREALCNALRHSGGTEVQVALQFEPQALVLRVADDGHGFDAEAAEARAPQGHFGLAGQRERAAAIGARLRLRSGPQGTELLLTVPAATAYRNG